MCPTSPAVSRKSPCGPLSCCFVVASVYAPAAKHGSHAWRLPNTRSTQVVTMRLLLSWSPSPNWRAKREEGWCPGMWSWILDPEEERRRWVLCCLILIVTENISRGHLGGCAESPKVSRSCGLTWWMLYSLINSLRWDWLLSPLLIARTRARTHHSHWFSGDRSGSFTISRTFHPGNHWTVSPCPAFIELRWLGPAFCVKQFTAAGWTPVFKLCYIPLTSQVALSTMLPLLSCLW